MDVMMDTTTVGQVRRLPLLEIGFQPKRSMIESAFAGIVSILLLLLTDAKQRNKVASNT